MTRKLLLAVLFASTTALVVDGANVLHAETSKAVAPAPAAAKPAEETVDSLKEKLATLQKNFQELKNDRDNLLNQSQRLLKENEDLKDAKNQVSKFTEERALLLQYKDNSEMRLKKLEAENEAYKKNVAAASKERNTLKEQLAKQRKFRQDILAKEKARLDEEYRGLTAVINPLRDENNKLKEDLKKTREDLKTAGMAAGGFQEESNLVKTRLAQLEQHFEEVRKENQALVEESRLYPTRFADLAAQNQRLIDETADMHYNLGVFYVNNKEYKRAIAEFEKGLKIKPNDPDTNYNLGYIYAEHIVDRSKAILYFKKYLTYAPDAEDADWVRKYLLTWQTWYGETSPIK